MSQSSENLDRIAALRAEIAQLEKQAVHELIAKREAVKQQLDELDAEIQRITGKAPRAGRGVGGKPRSGRSVSFDELKQMLESAPGRTINVRKLKLDFGAIKEFAKAHPNTLKLGGKGPWPTVTLV
jgi:hypothetical protein